MGCKKVTLSDVAIDISYGLSLSAQSIKTDNKLLRITDIQNGTVDWNKVPYCTPKSKNSRNKCCLKNGDIVFARTGATTGKSYLITSCPDGAVFASYLIRVSLNKLVLPKFLYHFFQTPFYWSQISSNSVGSTTAGVNSTKLKNLKIPLPPLEIQKRIVDLLDRAQMLIDKRKEQIALMDQFIQSLFYDMFGDPVLNPMGWEIKLIDKYINLLAGYAFKSKNYTSDKSQIKLCGGLIIMPWGIEWGNANYWNQNNVDGLEKYWLQKNDIVMAMDRPWISSGFKISRIKRKDLPSLLVQRTARIRCVNINSIFAFQMLKHKAFETHARPTETTVPHISPKDIRNFPIILPPLDLQNDFADRVEKIEIQKEAMTTSLRELEDNFNSLMQRAFKGKLDNE